MERARSHQIDRAAEKIFESRIPEGWATRKETPDYGIDFRVQIFDPKDPEAHTDIFAPTVPTSERFAVQVKGVEHPKGDEDAIKFRLETNALKYYVDVETDPVFLVVVDARNREAFWLFVQEYADEQLGGTDWRTQEKVTVNIPRSRRLVCDDAFREEVSRAIKYMALRKPKDVVAAILAEQQRLAKIDPRFDVKIVSGDEDPRNFGDEIW